MNAVDFSQDATLRPVGDVRSGHLEPWRSALPPYALVSRVDRPQGGDLGELWIARDTALNSPVLLHFLRPLDTPTPTTLATLRAHLACLRPLRGDGFVAPSAPHEHAQLWEDHLALVLDPLKEHEVSLRVWFDEHRERGQRPPTVGAWQILQELCGVLRVIHEASPPLAHGRLTAAEVLLLPRGFDEYDVRVMSVGLAPFHATTVYAHGLAPRPWDAMAPEQRDASFAADAATDVFTLGVIAVELFTGRPTDEHGTPWWRVAITPEGAQPALRRLLAPHVDLLRMPHGPPLIGSMPPRSTPPHPPEPRAPAGPHLGTSWPSSSAAPPLDSLVSNVPSGSAPSALTTTPPSPLPDFLGGPASQKSPSLSRPSFAGGNLHHDRHAAAPTRDLELIRARREYRHFLLIAAAVFALPLLGWSVVVLKTARTPRALPPVDPHGLVLGVTSLSPSDLSPPAPPEVYEAPAPVAIPVVRRGVARPPGRPLRAPVRRRPSPRQSRGLASPFPASSADTPAPPRREISRRAAVAAHSFGRPRRREWRYPPPPMRPSLTPLPFVLTLFAACTSSPATPAPTDAAMSDTPAATDAGCTYDGAADDTPDPTPHTPRWAFEPWISKDISDGPDTYAFVDGFRTRDIPVGAVVLDSPWETHYNTCVPNPSRYPDFPRLVREMHDRDVRVVLWITAFVNQTSYDLETGGDRYVGPSPNFAEGTACGFYVNDGETYAWWKGRGSSVDFFNPRARSWWHRQQDTVLDAGIDGWKLDFGESYIATETVRTAQGPVPHQRYSEAYYRDFLAYGRARRGADFLTMVRAWDESYQFPGRFFARREHAPVAWMGDNRRDRVGLIDALDHMFRSAAAGYPVVGSDLGGYLDRDDRALMNEIPYDHDTFLRWIALSALTPFMQLHGRGNFTPWTVPTRVDETVRDYRYWAKLHHAMVPFFYALAQEAWSGGPPILRPQGEMNQWPGDYRYTLGEALLVAPVLDETGRRDVALPAGEWYDWWSPRNDVITGASTQRGVDTSDRARIPLYVRAGAIIPLRVEDDTNGLGTTAAARALTVLVYPSTTMSRFTLHETDTPAAITAVRAADASSINLPPLTAPIYLRVRADRAFQGVTVVGQPVPSRASRAELDVNDSGWWSEETTRAAWVKLPMATAARVVRLAY